MALAPVITRELRVIARRKSTHRIRFFLVLGLFVFWLLLLTMAPSNIPFNRGKMVFTSLAFVGFLFCVMAGGFLTVGCVSEERREGTLGLLFLTPLNGNDVILGKFVATSISSIFLLIAMYPLLSYSWLVGGVTAGEFVRVNLCLLVTLIFSCSIGILASALTWEIRQSMALCAAMLGFFTVGLPPLEHAFSALLHHSWYNILSAFSPAALFGNSLDGPFVSRGGPWRFWSGLFALSIASAVALYAANRYVSQTWRREGPGTAFKLGNRLLRYRYGSTAWRTARKSQLARPYLWLAGRDRLAFVLMRALLIILLPCFLILMALSRRNLQWFFAGCLVSFFLHLSLKVLVSFDASRRLSEDRASGALEPLLVSPIKIADIIDGQRKAIILMIRWQMLLVLTTNVIALVTLYYLPPMAPLIKLFCGELLVLGIIALPLDIRALTWIGMWMAIRSRRHQRAVIATLARVVLIPYAAIIFIALFTIGGGMLTGGMLEGLVPLWFGLTAVIKSTLVAQAKVGLAEALRHYWAEERGPELEVAYRMLEST